MIENESSAAGLPHERPRACYGAGVAGIMAAAALAVLLAACGRQLDVSVTFNNPTTLATGTPVYLGEAKVGEVSGLTTTGVTTTAQLSLDPDQTAGLRGGTAALLTARKAGPVIELYNYRPGRDPLHSGAVLVGLNSTLEYAAWQAGETLATGKQSMNALAKTVTGYFQSEEWQRQKDEMNRQLESLRQQLGQSYNETSRAYRDFLNDLESQSEQARQGAKKSYAELVKRLGEQIEQLEAQGNEQLVEPLQKLLDELSRAMKKKPDQESG